VVFVKVDDMIFKVTRGHGQGQEMTSVPFRDYFILMARDKLDYTVHYWPSDPASCQALTYCFQFSKRQPAAWTQSALSTS